MTKCYDQLKTNVRACGNCNSYGMATNGITIDRDNEIITLEEYCCECHYMNIVRFRLYSTSVEDIKGLTVVPEEISENWRFSALNEKRSPDMVSFCPNCRKKTIGEETLTPGPDGCVITWECEHCSTHLTITIPKSDI